MLDKIKIAMLKCKKITQLNNNVINQQDNYFKQTPLQYATMNNTDKSIHWLLEHGTNS